MQHKYRVFLVCVTGIFITVFDTSSSIVALPTIALEFGTDLTTAQWVIIGNGLTIAALLVPIGRLSDVIGRKRIYVVGCSLFACGAFLASIATSIFGLIAARCIVGVGSAMTQGTAMAILIGNFPPEDRARLLGLQMAGVGIGGIAGPALGGLIVGTVGWRRLFAITLVVMVLVAIAGQRVLRRRAVRPDAPKEPFDTFGAVLFSAMLVTGLLMLTLGPRSGWSSAPTIAGGLLFCLLVVAFVTAERRHPSPMLDFAHFRNPAFALGALAGLVTFMGVSATRFLMPFFLQGVKAFDPSRVGLLMLPAAAITALVSPFAGQLADRLGTRLVANIGFGIAAVGLSVFISVHTDTSTWVAVAGLMIVALGVSSFSAANSASILNSMKPEAYGLATGFINLCRNSGNVIGIAFGTAVVALTMGGAGYPPTLSEVSAGAETGLFDAFTLGLRRTCLVLLCIVLPTLAIVVWSSRKRRNAGSDYSSSK